MTPDQVIQDEVRWIEKRYGSRRGFVRTIWHRFLYLLGRYDKYSQIDWSTVERVVFICKGNICRSAFAEAAARSMGIEAISCGLDTIDNAPANTDAISAARRLGINLDHHRTMPFMYLTLKSTDLLVAMEPWQARYLRNLLTRGHQYTLLGLWSMPVSPHIQDPYGANQKYFDKCFSFIHETVHEIASKIKKTPRS